MAARLSKIGAVFYALWGAIHIVGGAVLLGAALSSADAFLRAQAGSAELGLVALGNGVAPTVAGGVFAFHAFNLTWLGLVVLGVAVRLNWRSSRAGYWLNAALVGFTDLGLVLFIVNPGIMSWTDAWIGPALLVPALLFSTLGLRAAAIGPPIGRIDSGRPLATRA